MSNGYTSGRPGVTGGQAGFPGRERGSWAWNEGGQKAILCCHPKVQDCDDPESLRSETSLGSRNFEYRAGVGQRLVLEATKKSTKERAEGKGVTLGVEAKSAPPLMPSSQVN